MVAQKSLVLLAAIFAAARSQAPVGGELGGAHVARYLRGREDEEAPALHYFATDIALFSLASSPDFFSGRRRRSVGVDSRPWKSRLGEQVVIGVLCYSLHSLPSGRRSTRH